MHLEIILPLVGVFWVTEIHASVVSQHMKYSEIYVICVSGIFIAMTRNAVMFTQPELMYELPFYYFGFSLFC